MFDYLKKILEQVHQMDELVDDYKKLSPSGAMPSIAQVNKAIKLLKAKKIQEAEKILLEAEQIYPPSEAIFRTLAYLYESEKEFPKAIEYFKKSLHLNPIKKDLFLRLGYAQLSARDNEGALQTFDKALKVFPLDPEVITGHGMGLYRLGQYVDARTDFVKAFSLDAHNLNALFLCANVDVILGDYDRAETRLSLLVKLVPNTMHLYEYAKLKRIKLDWKNAEKYAKQIIKINKNFLPAYLLLAEIGFEQNDYRLALEWLDIAEKSGLITEALYLNRANICMYKEDFKSALEAYEKVAEYNVDKALEIQILSCKLLLDLPIENEKLLIILENNFEVEEDKELLAMQYVLMAIWHFKQNEMLKAEEFIKKALQITLKLPVVYYLLAQIYDDAGDVYKAEKYYNIVLEKNRNHYDAHKKYIEFLIKNKDYENARYKIKNALKIFPANSNLENLLFYVGFELLPQNADTYNVKELIKLAEKLEKNSTFLYAKEKEELLNRLHEGKN